MKWLKRRPKKVEVVFERAYGLGTWKVTAPPNSGIALRCDLNRGEVVVEFKAPKPKEA